MTNNKPTSPKQTTITDSQVGVVGDQAHIEGGIHFYAPPPSKALSTNFPPMPAAPPLYRNEAKL